MASKEEQLQELEQLHRRTLSDISRLREELQAEIEPASATDDDSADVAADIYERGKIISLIQSLESKLRSIEHAMAAFAKGSYGICESCGREIPAERLEIMPETTLCVQCASRLEQGIRRRQIMMADASESRSLYNDGEEIEEQDDNDD